jgi:hypothetical protein
MRIAIISDTHDNIWKLAEAMPDLSAADVVLHCGDICSPFVVKQLSEGISSPVHIVWGNNDGDKRLLTRFAEQAGNIFVHGDYGELNLDDFTVAMTHYPEIGRALAASNQFDLVCYGHDHIAHQERVGKTLLLNPGELMGMNGPGTFAIYDTESGKVETIALD